MVCPNTSESFVPPWLRFQTKEALYIYPSVIVLSMDIALAF